jgi:hypothetical protein
MPMAQLFSSFIPSEFLDAWIRGHYVIGPRTLDYQYAGLALTLRGFYRYDVKENVFAQQQKELFGGYVVAYIRNNQLNFAGFRLYSAAKLEKPPLFWRSPFSRFVEEDGDRKLYFPYHVFRERRPSLIDHRCTAIRSLASAKASQGRSYLDGIEDKRGDDLFELLMELSEETVGDPVKNPELRGLCTLTVPSSSDVYGRNKSDPKWDLMLTGNNYGVLADNPISGTVEFRRLKESFLDALSPKESEKSAEATRYPRKKARSQSARSPTRLRSATAPAPILSKPADRLA